MIQVSTSNYCLASHTGCGRLRLGADADVERPTLVIYDIEHRSGAYKPGDGEVNVPGSVFKHPHPSVRIVREAGSAVRLSMEITGVTQHHVSVPLNGAFEPTWIPGYAQHSHEAEVFEIETDAGITGVTASPSFGGGFDYETPLGLFLAGEDPHDVEGILQPDAALVTGVKRAVEVPGSASRRVSGRRTSNAHTRWPTQSRPAAVWVNTYNDLLDPPSHGGFKESAIGRELAEEALDDYSQVRSVKMNFGEVPEF